MKVAARTRKPAGARSIEHPAFGWPRRLRSGNGWLVTGPPLRSEAMLSPQTGMNERRQRTPAFSSDDARWEAVRRRDAGADGLFFYAVRTTGVYCRPSCPARLPHRENVTFHATPADAEGGGFRPCRRCRPNAA